MTIRLTICFFFFSLFNLASGQNIEQIALGHLLSDLSLHDIKFDDGRNRFNSDSNKVWYAPEIIDGQEKVSIPNATIAGIEWFYKVIHSNHDIHIRTYKAKEIFENYVFPFTITSNYNNITNFVVTLTKKKQLLSIKVTD